MTICVPEQIADLENRMTQLETDIVLIPKGDKGDPGDEGPKGDDGDDGNPGTDGTQIPFYASFSLMPAIPHVPVAIVLGSGSDAGVYVDQGDTWRKLLGVDASTYAADRYRVSIAYESWTALAAHATPAPTNGMTAAVFGDAGTHADPVVGGNPTVNNTGVYRYSTAPAGWRRISNLESADCQTALTAVQVIQTALTAELARVGQFLPTPAAAFAQIGLIQMTGGNSQSYLNKVMKFKYFFFDTNRTRLVIEVAVADNTAGLNEVVIAALSTNLLGSIAAVLPYVDGAAVPADLAGWRYVNLIPQNGSGVSMRFPVNFGDATTTPAGFTANAYAGGYLDARLNPAGIISVFPQYTLPQLDARTDSRYNTLKSYDYEVFDTSVTDPLLVRLFKRGVVRGIPNIGNDIGISFDERETFRVRMRIRDFTLGKDLAETYFVPADPNPATWPTYLRFHKSTISEATQVEAWFVVDPAFWSVVSSRTLAAGAGRFKKSILMGIEKEASGVFPYPEFHVNTPFAGVADLNIKLRALYTDAPTGVPGDNFPANVRSNIASPMNRVRLTYTNAASPDSTTQLQLTADAQMPSGWSIPAHTWVDFSGATVLATASDRPWEMNHDGGFLNLNGYINHENYWMHTDVTYVQTLPDADGVQRRRINQYYENVNILCGPEHTAWARGSGTAWIKEVWRNCRIDRELSTGYAAWGWHNSPTGYKGAEIDMYNCRSNMREHNTIQIITQDAQPNVNRVNVWGGDIWAIEHACTAANNLATMTRHRTSRRRWEVGGDFDGFFFMEDEQSVVLAVPAGSTVTGDVTQVFGGLDSDGLGYNLVSPGTIHSLALQFGNRTGSPWSIVVNGVTINVNQNYSGLSNDIILASLNSGIPTTSQLRIQRWDIRDLPACLRTGRGLNNTGATILAGTWVRLVRQIVGGESKTCMVICQDGEVPTGFLVNDVPHNRRGAIILNKRLATYYFPEILQARTYGIYDPGHPLPVQTAAEILGHWGVINGRLSFSATNKLGEVLKEVRTAGTLLGRGFLTCW